MKKNISNLVVKMLDTHPYLVLVTASAVILGLYSQVPHWLTRAGFLLRARRTNLQNRQETTKLCTSVPFHLTANTPTDNGSYIISGTDYNSLMQFIKTNFISDKSFDDDETMIIDYPYESVNLDTLPIFDDSVSNVASLVPKDPFMYLTNQGQIKPIIQKIMIDRHVVDFDHPSEANEQVPEINYYTITVTTNMYATQFENVQFQLNTC